MSIPIKVSSRCLRVNNTRERGVVLVLAIFAVALLTVLIFGIAAGVRTELLASSASVTRVQSLFLAQAGLNEARALLMYDDPLYDALQDDWGTMAEQPLEDPHELTQGYYRGRVYDACGRIDVNLADYNTLLNLTGDEVVTASIVDWRDEDDAIINTNGAETDYYQSLALPYTPRNGPLETIGELLLVRGMTPALFFGTADKPGLVDLLTVESLSLNLNPDGKVPLNLNSIGLGAADNQTIKDFLMARLGNVISMYEADQLIEGLMNLSRDGSPGYSSFSQLLTAAGLEPGRIAQMIDYVSYTDDTFFRGKVNLNTAPLEVLAALPGSSESLAEEIIAHRREFPFTRLGEVVSFLFEQPGGTALFSMMIDRVTIRSSSYLVESMGAVTEDRGYRVLTTLLRRSPEAVSVIRQAEQDWPLSPILPEYVAIAKNE